MSVLQIKLNQNFYLRDPQDTELGRNIVKNSIEMIDAIGFEAFTFKKLSVDIGSTEASIYRYFESKHKLLVYLLAWYWAWLEYSLDYATNHIEDASEKLEIALKIITHHKQQDHTFPDINETSLQHIVIAESDKVYLTKEVDTNDENGLFKGYKTLCRKLSQMIRALNPEYPYTKSLSSTILEASHQQIFFACHLKSLTEASESSDAFEHNSHFLKSLVFNSIQA